VVGGGFGKVDRVCCGNDTNIEFPLLGVEISLV
jgi:hypothetical protein